LRCKYHKTVIGAWNGIISAMDFITLLFIACGLAMDSFAVSVASGFTISDLRPKNAFTIALFFGFFQGFMPVIGWFAGYNMRDVIAGVDHWIAFSLLAIIGLKMIYESAKMNGKDRGNDPPNIAALLVLSIATSIDALAVGFSLSLLKVMIITPALVIGLVTFVLSFLGVYIGDRFGHFFEKKLELAGGVILIGIGLKILIEHLSQLN
jgi:putative Mn2+ efflux pump MntP